MTNSPGSVQSATSVKGSTEPRIFTPTLDGRELTPETSWGFSCIAFLTLILGWKLMPWQEWLYVHALEKNEAGTGLRYKTIVLLIARQNGKTQWLKGLALWKLYVDGAKVVTISAQNLEIAETTLAEAVADVKANKLLRREFRGFTQTNGKFKLRLSATPDDPETQRMWRVATATRKGGRSLSVDMNLLDELREHQTWKAWDAITPTALTRPRSLNVAASNAGDATSVVLSSLRNGAIKRIIGKQTGKTRTGLFEWSAPEDCDPFAEEFWPQANPSLGYLFDIEDLRGYLEAKEDDIAGWQTEYLCQWVLSLTPSIIPEKEWAAGHDATSKRAETSPIWLSVDVNYQRTKGYIGVAALRDDGTVHGEVIAAQRGTEWIAHWFEDPLHPERLTRFAGVVVQARGAPASGLISKLRKAGGEWVDLAGQPCTSSTLGAIQRDGPLNVVELGGPDLTKAYGDALDLINEGKFNHRPSPALDAAAAGSRAKFLGDAWVIDRKGSAVDVSPIITLIQASWGLALTPEPVKLSAYEAGGLTVV